jgi:hypothetical protein
MLFNNRDFEEEKLFHLKKNPRTFQKLHTSVELRKTFKKALTIDSQMI